MASMRQDSTDPTGVRAPIKNTEVIRARDRKANAALNLRKYGADWTEVATTLGYPTARAALVAVEKSLESENGSAETKAFVRRLISEQFDMLLAAILPDALAPKADENGERIPNPDALPFIDRVIRILDRKAKLHGADAPTEFVVSSPSMADIEQWVTEVTGYTTPDVDEADIFDDNRYLTVKGEVTDEQEPGQVSDDARL